MQGRMHGYEGYPLWQTTLAVRVLRELGAQVLVLSSAVGGLNPSYAGGDLMLVDDHINLMGDNPLIGWNDDRLGNRFPDMSEPYTRSCRLRAEQVALELGIPLRRGVLVAVAGPNLETAAEYRFLRRAGADIVGMSMVPETLVAVHAGMRVLGLCVVTDLCRPDALEAADLPRIIATAQSAEPRLRAITVEYLKRSPA
jgi:purine-nucleoside phosphorylase